MLDANDDTTKNTTNSRHPTAPASALAGPPPWWAAAHHHNPRPHPYPCHDLTAPAPSLMEAAGSSKAGPASSKPGTAWPGCWASRQLKLPVPNQHNSTASIYYLQHMLLRQPPMEQGKGRRHGTNRPAAACCWKMQWVTRSPGRSLSSNNQHRPSSTQQKQQTSTEHRHPQFPARDAQLQCHRLVCFQNGRVLSNPLP